MAISVQADLDPPKYAILPGQVEPLYALCSRIHKALVTMACIISNDGVLISSLPLREHSSSLYGSARTHQSAVRRVSSRREFSSSLDSVEDTPSEQDSLYDHTSWSLKQCDSDSKDGADSSAIKLDDRNDTELDGCSAAVLEDYQAPETHDFTTLIRAHGAPLDTITERTSASTIPETIRSPEDSWYLGVANLLDRKASAPDARSLRRWVPRELRGTRSLDERILVSFRCTLMCHDELENSKLVSAYGGVAKPREAAVAPPRIPTPPERPRSPGDLANIDPKPAVTTNRKTSAYVRGIYRKLLRADNCDEKPTSAASPSRIPVPTHLARGAKAGRPYRKPFVSEHAKGELKDVSNHPSHTSTKPQDDKGHGSTSSQKGSPGNLSLCTENQQPSPSRSIPKRLSSIIPRAKRVSESPRALGPITVDTVSPGALVASSTVPENHASARTSTDASTQTDCDLVGSQCSLGIERNKQPSVDKTFQGIVCNRSIFDIRATERFACFEHPQQEDKTLGAEKPVLRVRNGLPSSPDSRNSELSDTPNSWKLPLDPFPLPPSPNLFVTPCSSRNFRDDPTSHRHTSAGVPVTKVSEPSLCSIDLAAEAVASRSIAASDSSASIIAGPSMSQNRPTLLTGGNDPFIASRTADAGKDLSSSKSSLKNLSSPETQLHMPSPLRPRKKGVVEYSLFPPEPGVNEISRSSVKSIAVRKFRSLSSMLRVPSVTMRASKSSDLNPRHTEKICPHGELIERVDVFTGRKLGSCAWRTRHWLRDGGLSCWKCQICRVRDKFRELRCIIFGTKRSTRRTDIAAWTSSDEPRASDSVGLLGNLVNNSGTARRCRLRKTPASAKEEVTHPGTEPGERARSAKVKHPLEDIQERRAAQDKKLNGSTSIQKMLSLGEKCLLSVPRCCFCQVIDDNDSPRAPRPARSRRPKDQSRSCT